MLAKEVRYTTSKPQTSRPIDLNKIPIPSFYFLMLEFVRARWPDLKLTSDQEPKPDGYPFMYDRVAVPLPFVYHNGIKFGCSTAKRTKANKFAFISKGKEPQMCAVVRRMVADNNIPVMLWDSHAIELEAFTAYANQFADSEIIRIEDVVAPIALCLLSARYQFPPYSRVDLWVAILYKKTGAEAATDEDVSEDCS
ncbi:hypothetical protein FRC12_011696 [Ceratobasidium sp. 428]|nr:hypothetical protein FRC12_011696 [Ceratobasidium sp. 428]